MSNRNRNRRNRQKSNETGANPMSPKASPKKDLIDLIGGFISGASSYKGSFWLGVGIAGLSFFKNVSFYSGTGIAVFEWSVGLAGIAGFSFAAATTYFEVAPWVRKTSGALALQRAFRIASRPKKLPKITDAQYHDPEEPADRYKRTVDGLESFGNIARWICIGVEVFIGVLALAHAGTGLAAIMELIMFIGSIFGTLYGIVLAMKSYDMHMPTAVRAQMTETMNRNERVEM